MANLTDSDIARIVDAIKAETACACSFNQDELATLKHVVRSINQTQKIAFRTVVSGVVLAILSAVATGLGYYLKHLIGR